MDVFDPLYDAEPDWDAIFADPAVLEVIDSCPLNSAEPHDEDDDERILENARRRAPWLNRIMHAVITETEDAR